MNAYIIQLVDMYKALSFLYPLTIGFGSLIMVLFILYNAGKTISDFCNDLEVPPQLVLINMICNWACICFFIKVIKIIYN